MPSHEHHKVGDALRAERIAVQARAIDRPRVVEGSGRDKIQRTTLRGSAYCVIQIPLKWILDKKP
jgi:hypothetical protein